MIPHIWLVVSLLLFSFLSFAQAEDDCAPKCASQLLRVEIAANVLSSGNAQGLLPALKSLSESPTLTTSIQKSYPLIPIGFPQTLETCLREKAEGDDKFKNVDCHKPGLCSEPYLDAEVREKICFKLPCPVLEGTLNLGKCDEIKDIYPNGISFPIPLEIQKIGLSPTKVDFKKGEANLCFRINELAIKMSTSLSLDTRNTSLPDKSIDVYNINPVLDGPRELCVSANINFGSDDPVSNIKLTPQGNGPFISDNMIREAAKKLQIRGLSGYPHDQLAKVQTELVSVLFQPLRDSIEKSLKDSLSLVFTDLIKKTVAPFAAGNSTTIVDSRNMMSELGVVNMQVKDQLAKAECSQIKMAKREIPPKHPCLGLPHFSGVVTPEFDGSSIELDSFLSMAKGKKITSESIKQRLIALKEVILAEKPGSFFSEGRNEEEIAEIQRWHIESAQRKIDEEINPLIHAISNNQIENQLYDFMEIQSQLNQGTSNSIGLSLPELCSDKPSPHAGKKIKNCPVQVYADLNEFNKVLKKMFDTGRLCSRGEGNFDPKLDAGGKPTYDQNGKPLANGGCYVEVEGMGCHMKAPPQIKYDKKTKKYGFNLGLQGCFRGPVIFGIGKFGGDFNIDFAFEPKACSNGDFCMENPDIKWNVVPGTERFGLSDSSFLKKIITNKLNEAITGSMKNTIRLPMAQGVGPLASIPLQAEGRVDSGPGYFGACLEIPKGASGQ
jgi:hypothetical protein